LLTVSNLGGRVEIPGTDVTQIGERVRRIYVGFVFSGIQPLSCAEGSRKR
jgi:hypothetical protein